MRILIVGCGYVGLELGREWVARGAFVAGVRRSIEGAGLLAEAGLATVVGDVTRLEEVMCWPGGWDVVVNAVSSSLGGAEVYRRVYGDGTRHLLEWMTRVGVGRYVHLGSTSVYGQTDGGWVDEDSSTEPKAETSRVLVETEQVLRRAHREAGFPAVMLRVAGIYGPGRGYQLQQLLRGEARIQGDGSRWVNMVHRDDVAAAVRAVGEAPVASVAGRVFNVMDDEPVSQGEFVTWLAHEYGQPVPPVASDEENAARKRGLTHKRVRNRRLRTETGWVPTFGTYREGYRRAGPSATPEAYQPLARGNIPGTDAQKPIPTPEGLQI